MHIISLRHDDFNTLSTIFYIYAFINACKSNYYINIFQTNYNLRYKYNTFTQIHMSRCDSATRRNY